MAPSAWHVEWDESPAGPAGSARFDQRARARGFAIMQKARGFIVRVTAVF